MISRKIEAFGSFDRNKLYCTGSFTKLLTTFVILSQLSEDFNLNAILDDENFLDTLCVNHEKAKSFLNLFQKIIGSQFTLRDLCTYYTGLPYTFEPDEAAVESVEAGNLFKHHSILDEEKFLNLCKHKISTLYPNRSKFHYSEISIIFMGYLIEKVYDTTIENLYAKYLINKFELSASQISGTRPAHAYTQDASHKYDWPAIAIQDHGYFKYSNGFYTTAEDAVNLFSNLMNDPIFINFMTDIQHARVSDNDTVMNGLTVELIQTKNDLIYTYDGVSFSGCFVWAYSTKLKKGYFTFCNDDEKAHEFIYHQLGCAEHDIVPDSTKAIYSRFIANLSAITDEKDIPAEYQGDYQRVNINENDNKLIHITTLGRNFLSTRDPDNIKYNLRYVNGSCDIIDDDNTAAAKVNLYTTQNGKRYMFYEAGVLYEKRPHFTPDPLQCDEFSHAP